ADGTHGAPHSLQGDRCRIGRGDAGGGARGALGVDELVEPTHLALDRLEAVTLKLEGVAVESLASAGQRETDAFAALLEPAAPSLEDPQPGLRVGAPEEREVDAEVVVLPRGRAGFGEERLEVLLPVRGDLVDDLAAPPRLGLRAVSGDEAGREELL